MGEIPINMVGDSLFVPIAPESCSAIYHKPLEIVTYPQNEEFIKVDLCGIILKGRLQILDEGIEGRPKRDPPKTCC